MKMLLVVLVILAAMNVNGQYANVKLNNTYVGGEVWIAMNPKNVNNLVVGTHGQFITSQSNMLYYYSMNGGYNWTGRTMLSTLAQPGTDPVVVVDTNGYFYYICLGNWGTPPPNLDKLLCNKSTDGGVNWNNGVTFGVPAPRMNDMPMACVDLSNSQYGNSIYVTWTMIDSMQSTNPLDSSYVYFSRSTNQGQTFSTAKRISKIAGKAAWDYSTPEGPVPCTGTNGEIYVTYPYNSKVLFTRSLDGGNIWLNNEIIAANQAGGWPQHHSPVITCDLSNSQYRGNVYICFSDLRNGPNNRDIFLTKSTNKGDNWSAPVKVNNNTNNTIQEMPWICVDPVTGYIWIVFYDGRNYSTLSLYDVYVARSTNGGASFQNVKVSDNNSKTLASAWNGDYIGITANNNKVRPVWTTSTGSSNNDIWTAIIDSFTVGIQSISTEIPSSYSLKQNYPNPFNPVTNIKFDIILDSRFRGNDTPRRVVLKVYDVMGREVQTLVNESFQPGKYETTFDGSMLNSGVYFYKLITDGFTDTKRMILIK
jgi:hypothetical protein